MESWIRFAGIIRDFLELDHESHTSIARPLSYPNASNSPFNEGHASKFAESPFPFDRRSFDLRCGGNIRILQFQYGQEATREIDLFGSVCVRDVRIDAGRL